MSLLDLVKPENVRTDSHFWETFGHTETETSARWIVQFLQKEKPGKGWAPFPMADLQAYYERSLGRSERFHLNRLPGQGHVSLQDGTVTIATTFVSAICSNPELVRA